MTAKIVLDTNVMSELMRPSPDSYVVAWYESQDAGALVTTSITMAEVLLGLELMPQGQRRDRLVELSRVAFEIGMKGRILDFNEFAARQYAVLRASKSRRGLQMSPLDAQIAAIALAADAAVATRNTKDFENCGLTLINPWLA